MGRQQYLTRLALGRSAFQNPDTDEDANSPASVSDEAAADFLRNLNNDGSTDETDQGYVQQYDSKGRPVNPVTVSRNAEMRHAMNSVLALVGVVEAREGQDARTATMYRVMKECRHTLLEEEHERGDDLKLVFTILAHWPVWAIECLLQRYQLGMHRPHRPFMDAVTSELRLLSGTGLGGATATFLPGAAAYIVHILLRSLLHSVTEAAIGRLQEAVGKLRLKKKTFQRLQKGLDAVLVALLLAVDWALLPLDFYSIAQQLGIAPAWPLFPPMRSMLPWHPTSVHHFDSAPLLALPSLRSLASPVSLLLVRGLMERDAGEEDPRFSDFTAFRYPPINGKVNTVNRPTANTDPLGWLLYQGYRLRCSILHWSGWIVRPPGSRAAMEGRYETKTVTGFSGTGGRTTVRGDRSTALAHLPAEFLAIRIDEIAQRVLMLPFQGLLSRVVASAYLQSSLPITPRGLDLAHQFYAPFGSGPFAAIWSARGQASSFVGLGQYLSKLGLCFALQVSVEAAMFGAIYSVVRWQGVRFFDWGSTTKIGTMYYKTPPSSRRGSESITTPTLTREAIDHV